MKFNDIEQLFLNKGWKRLDISCDLFEYSKGETKVYIVDTEDRGLCIAPFQNCHELCYIGEIYKFEFCVGSLRVFFYNGEQWVFKFHNDATEFFYKIPGVEGLSIQKPDDWDDVDERPHHFVIEVSEIRKTNLSIFAYSFEEAKNLIMNLSDEEAEEKIEKRMDDSGGCNYHIVEENKNNHFSRSMIDEFDVERSKESLCMKRCKSLLLS